MIDNSLDIDRWKRELATHSRVQIADFLQLDAAERLRDCLAREVHWTLAERSESTSRTRGREQALTDAEYRQVLDTAYARARDEFQFVYDSYMLVRARKEGWDPELILHFVLEFLNSPEFLDFARYLTGDAAINAVNAQATRYRPGHFLTPHEDIHETEGRRYAYVINLTRNWKPEWGGLLQFIDAAGNVIDTFAPRWNSLSLFRVPALHAVSLVTPWAGEERLAITGWFLVR
jgi:SM-20-related protein